MNKTATTKKSKNALQKVYSEPTAAIKTPRTRKRLSREERAPNARKEILAAAAKVVGEHGYANASIHRITAEAGIAQGTFYLYFASRQALFDELLPLMGVEMLQYVREGVRGAKDVYDMEERGVRMFFKYCELNPSFFRVLNEAEVAAPVAHQRHFKRVTERYLKSLERAITANQISNFGPDELETVVYMLMAARIFLHLRMKKEGVDKLPEKMLRAYMKFVRSGLN